MESLALGLAIPIAAIASLLYVRLAEHLLVRAHASEVVRVVSAIVLIAIAVVIGAIMVDAQLVRYSPIVRVLYMFAYFLGPPAVTNLLFRTPLWRTEHRYRRAVTVLFCYSCCLAALIVDRELYGRIE